jgi:hypothetical protein
MPIRFGKPESYKTVLATNEWSKVTLRGVKADDFKVATELFYVGSSKID